MEHDKSRRRILSDPAPPPSAALAPFRIRNYRFQWPARSAHLVGVRDRGSLILGWLMLVETGSVLLPPCSPRFLGYIGTLVAPMFGVVGDRTRSSRPPGDDAPDLRGAGGRADGAGVVGPPRRALCVHGRGRDGRRSRVENLECRGRLGGGPRFSSPVDRGDDWLHAAIDAARVPAPCSSSRSDRPVGAGPSASRAMVSLFLASSELHPGDLVTQADGQRRRRGCQPSMAVRSPLRRVEEVWPQSRPRRGSAARPGCFPGYPSPT